VASPLPDVESPEDDPRCVACGGFHGGVTRELLCLRAEVARLRTNRTPKPPDSREVDRLAPAKLTVPPGRAVRGRPTHEASLVNANRELAAGENLGDEEVRPIDRTTVDGLLVDVYTF
jgi:hypothetical protein